MDASEGKPLEEVDPLLSKENSNPVIDDHLLSLLHEDFAREQVPTCKVIEEQSAHVSVADPEETEKTKTQEKVIGAEKRCLSRL